MGINPSDEKCIPFYNKIKELNMVLTTHTYTHTHLILMIIVDITSSLW